MSKSKDALPSLLARALSPKVRLDFVSGNKLKDMLSPWIGSGPAQKLRVEERRRMLEEVLADKERVRQVVDELPEPQRQILAVCKRYGGAVTGALFGAEVTARGLVKAERPERVSYYERDKKDPVSLLKRHLLLLSWEGGYLGEYYSYGYYGSGAHYTDVALLPSAAAVVEPAPPLPSWPATRTVAPASVEIRSTAEVAFDLWTVAQVLHDMGTWKTSKSGSLPKAPRNRVHKTLAPPEDNPLTPPEVESLYYELLRGLDALEIADGEGLLDRAAVERHLDRPAVQQSWRLVQAWMHAVLWQDGIGVVPDRDSEYDRVRIHPESLRDGKELIVWALQRVAQGANDWLDLSAFIAEFGTAVSNHFDAGWYGCSWQPKLKKPGPTSDDEGLQSRQRAYWMEEGGRWTANAIMGTLGHLGLVERGDVEKRPCFRLTPLGQAVFAAPEPVALPPAEPHFLTVQPNHEIVAYLNTADASTVWRLARMARRVSTTAGLVQTFALTRDSVYQALESGLTLEDMQRFLRDHSTTGLPANVAMSLAEWGRKREALTLRTGVSILVQPSEPAVVLSKPALAVPKPKTVIDHLKAPGHYWQADEEGQITVTKDADVVAQARLSQFADADGPVWRITAASARRARQHGIRSDQVLAWLDDHTGAPLPLPLETMIRNWTDGGSVFLGELLLLQAPQEQTCTMLREHPRFEGFFLANLSPNWFIVRPEKRTELERLLHEMGFATNVAWKPPKPEKSKPQKSEPEIPPRKRRKKRRR